MKRCSLSDFMEIITPWLSSEYLRRVYKDDKGHILLEFRDGVKDVYQIEDCTEEQLTEVLEGFKEKGIRVEE
ncbi:MAG: hypothetical protein HON76_06165 [Candidatus Scalindua sp.]|jgi:hypothetical protein|nr:hypothetical protein [Candidatus Scalindua sp.]MBT5304791.1 hypothetical protein [Candidatus Scalindua sp.]MBT6046436.1 hypothetical protein [Candidatus Scalindua sp.]MBT6229630.1 hypothetical protein [Candidatus Scalindua sp.]MBT6562095.1 hypothetical protein [Candidatus Scalindua sp.]